MVAEPLARHREQFGPAPDLDVPMPSRHLHMCFMPPRWDGESAPRPANPSSFAIRARCGQGRVKEALSEAVPMVVIPITTDQRYSAECCAALGAARVSERA